MAKQISAGPTWRKYEDRAGKALGWTLMVAGVFWGAMLLFRAPNAEGVSPGLAAPIVTLLVFCGFAAPCFAFRSCTLVDESKRTVEISRGLGQARPVRSYNLAEFCGIVVGRTGGRSMGYRIELDRGPSDARRLVMMNFDGRADAEAEALALAALTGLPVIHPDTDPLAYRRVASSE